MAITEWGVDADNVLEVSFEKNPLHLSCSQFDNVYVWVWCPEVGVGYLANAVYRRMKHMSTVLPQIMAGKEVHVYAFVQDERGRCSNTAYGGSNPQQETEGEEQSIDMEVTEANTPCGVSTDGAMADRDETRQRGRPFL